MDEQNCNRLVSALESILFISGDPISKKKLMKLIDVTQEDLEEILENLEMRCSRAESGLSLIEKDDTLVLVTKAKNAPLVEKLMKKDVETPLSSSLLEVLSIVAYRAPVSRQEIEYIRGANCTFALRNLLVRGLIQKVDHPQNNRVFFYGPTSLFLESVGLTSLKQLPDYEELQKDPRLIRDGDGDA
ncbi:MAG: SMC-Scp complex subunit ScpB [Candidatus Moraniibacteriota bacterium]|nr:MAG: SMC-Scp complex subunit ScpB [Candidatus Moranbacteria bacterium]